MLAISLALLTPAAPACAIDHARYVLRADPTVELRFHIVPRSRDWWNEVAAELTLGRTRRTSWWLPATAGTSDYRAFVWTALRGSPQAAATYPYKLKSLQYFGFDWRYDLINDNVRRGARAPAHILLDNLREAFWYQDDPASRISPPLSLFDLVACDVAHDSPDVILPDVP